MSNERDAKILRRLEVSRRSLNRLVEHGVDQIATEAKRNRDMGKYWSSAREEAGMKVWEMGERLAIDDALIGGYEMGLKPEIWNGVFPIQYAGALDRPELYPEFCSKFNIPPFEIKTNSQGIS